MPFTYDAIRAQYARNAAQMAKMIESGRYRGLTRDQLIQTQARAAACAVMTDQELADHLADCQRKVSAQLARMITE